MANIKASKADIKTNARNRIRNSQFKSRMRTSIKAALSAVEDRRADASDLVKIALRTIDKTAAKGVIKRQTASRKKSRLSLAFNKSLVPVEAPVTVEVAKKKSKKSSVKSGSKKSPGTGK